MLKFLMIGAHPDDMDLRCGGLASLLTERGHEAVFLSIANGNAGHMSMDAAALRLRRRGEMIEAGKVYGVRYDTLDIDDCTVVADLPTRERLLRYIRRENPDAIVTHRSCDYHADHRACGQLVMDCSYLLQVPMYCPDTPALRHAPVVLYCEDRFTSPAPFRADIAVNCDPVIERKIEGVMKHRSQLLEWLPYDGHWEEVLAAKTEEEAFERVVARERERFAAPVKRFPDRFPAGTTYGEVYQIDEYGGKMTDEIRRAMEG